jgi:hypothetical protein
MSTAHTTDYDRVLKIIQNWPAAHRLTLVQAVLKTLAPSDVTERPPQARTLEQARGLLATNRPAPTDEEIAQWLDERRTEHRAVWHMRALLDINIPILSRTELFVRISST